MVKVGAHLVQRTASLLAAPPVATAAASRVGTVVVLAVMVRPSLGLGGVWLGLLLWVSVRALRNHRRVQGDEWMAGAGAVR